MSVQQPGWAGDALVVTGASRGIGKATAVALLDEGATVIGTATKQENLAELRSAADQLPGGTLICAQLDVRDPQSVDDFAELAASAVPAIRALINNAGCMDDAETLAEQTPEGWDTVLATNLTGPYLMTRALLPLFEKEGGACVVNVTGGMGTFSSGMEDGGFAAYRVSKAGLNALTLSLSQEFGEQGISVCSFDPGWVRTDLGGDDADLAPEEAAAALLGLLARMRGAEQLSGVLVTDGAVSGW
jgi:NAD(P)-dependent dehydrogenase (short-subunit alcohol dehydrogenase family)